MPFKRVWDSTCPRVWAEWEDNGAKWVIQDIPPEDDEKIVKIMTTKFIVDEILCYTVGVINDPVSVACTTAVWRDVVGQRTSLGCYVERDGKRTLAGLNCCFVKCKGDDMWNTEGEPWLQVSKSMAMMEEGIDAFSLVGDDKYLYGLGLFVEKDFRGYGLGTKLLTAREPMCKHLGVKGTVTVFSGPASQRSAEKAGFITLVKMSMKDYAEAGLRFPADDTKVVTYTWRKYV